MTNDRALEQAIEKMGAGTGNSFANLFDEFLDAVLAMMCNNPSDHQRKVLASYLSDGWKKQAFLEAMKAYGEAAEGYHDPLGEMFMLRISHGQNGQFFTPENICSMMAEMMDPQDGSICDPTCGSGRLLLSGLKVSRRNGLEPVLYGNDLSITCAKMTLANLLFNSARGEVSCGNSLLMDLRNFRFFRIDRVRMPGGWLSTYWQYTLEDVEEVDRQRDEWRARMLASGIPVEILPVPKSRESVPEEAETVPESVDPVPTEAESVPSEPKYDHLTATPKAVQLELNLF